MTLRHFLRSTLVPVAMLFFFFFASASPAAEYTSSNPLILKMQTMFMPAHAVIKYGLAPWAEEIKTKSGGRLIVEIYNPNTICPEGDIYDAVRDGILDIGVQATQRVKGIFPLSNVIDLPFMFPGAEIAARTFNELAAEFPELKAEYEGTEVLTFWDGCPYQLHTKDKPINTVADLKGRKIGGVSTATAVPFIESLGASALNVPLADLYVAMQRGQIDTVLAPFPTLVSAKIYEATNYSSIINALSGGVYMVMNKDVLSAMPEDLRKILLDSAGPELGRKVAAGIDRSSNEDLAIALEAGQKLNEIPKSEIQAAFASTQHIVEDWISDCEKQKGQGEVARAIYNRALELSAKYSAESGIEWNLK